MEIAFSEVDTAIADALKEQLPLKGLSGVRIRNVHSQPEEPFDISFELTSGKSTVLVLGEVKPAFSPRLLEEIAPWIRRLKSLRRDVAIAVLAPALTIQSQQFCIENDIDFIDLAGNIFISVPGLFTLQRTGMRSREPIKSSTIGELPNINVFSGRSSRILRVLLQNPRSWAVTEIAKELSAESRRIGAEFPESDLDFDVSLGTISKAVATLEEQLLIRRRGTSLYLPEPVRLLQEWAQKYKERYRWRLRSSFEVSNPLGTNLFSNDQGLKTIIRGAYAFTGATAASATAPLVDIDLVEVFVCSKEDESALRKLKDEPIAGPKLRFIYPYDIGVFMYCKRNNGAPLVSGVQAYLDLYARGGRDLKQAEHLLVNAIQPGWSAA